MKFKETIKKRTKSFLSVSKDWLVYIKESLYQYNVGKSWQSYFGLFWGLIVVIAIIVGLITNFFELNSRFFTQKYSIASIEVNSEKRGIILKEKKGKIFKVINAESEIKSVSLNSNKDDLVQAAYVTHGPKSGNGAVYALNKYGEILWYDSLGVKSPYNAQMEYYGGEQIEFVNLDSDIKSEIVVVFINKGLYPSNIRVYSNSKVNSCLYEYWHVGHLEILDYYDFNEDVNKIKELVVKAFFNVVIPPKNYLRTPQILLVLNLEDRYGKKTYSGKLDVDALNNSSFLIFPYSNFAEGPESQFSNAIHQIRVLKRGSKLPYKDDVIKENGLFVHTEQSFLYTINYKGEVEDLTLGAKVDYLGGETILNYSPVRLNKEIFNQFIQNELWDSLLIEIEQDTPESSF